MTTPKFALARATTEDIPEMVDVMYTCFDEFVRLIVMGCSSRDDLPRLVSQYAKESQTDRSDIWVKVTDLSNDRIVAASNWKMYSTSALPRGVDRVKPWISDERIIELCRTVLEPMNELRLRVNADRPFLHLHICFTAAQHRRKGLGSMMMQWGCDLMDRLSMSGWIEASPEGNFLYKRFGFHDYEQIVHEGVVKGQAMKREPKLEPIHVGKTA